MKPLTIVVLANPKTDAAGMAGLGGMIRQFARTIGRPVRVGKIITNPTLPVGQVYCADAREPWVKKMRRK